MLFFLSFSRFFFCPSCLFLSSLVFFHSSCLSTFRLIFMFFFHLTLPPSPSHSQQHSFAFWVFTPFSCDVIAMYVVLLWAISVMSLCMWVLSHAFVSVINDRVYCTNRIHFDAGCLSSSASRMVSVGIRLFWFTICRSPQPLFTYLCMSFFCALPGASFRFSHNEQIFLNCVKRKKVLLIKLSVAKRHFQCTHTHLQTKPNTKRRETEKQATRNGDNSKS